MNGCRHAHFETSASMEYRQELASPGSLKRVTYMVAKVKISCKVCGKKFTFRGQTGNSPYEATVSEALDELRIPVEYPQRDDGEKESEEGQIELFATPPVYLQ